MSPNKITHYNGYLLDTKYENGNSVTTIVKDNLIVSMTFASSLDKIDAEQAAKNRIDGEDKTGIYKF